MKKTSYIIASLCALALVFSCEKEPAVVQEPVNSTDIETPVVTELVTISATLSEALTKVSFDPAITDGKPVSMALTWAAGDKIRVYDHSDHSTYADFTLDAASVGKKEGVFTGTPISATAYDAEVINGDVAYATQTQPSDGVTTDLKYFASAEDIAGYTSIEFTDFSSVLAITAKMPSTAVAAVIKSVDITASEDIFNGGKSLTITLGTVGDKDNDGILIFYATMPKGSTAIADGTSLLVHFNAPETSHDVYTRYIELPATSFAANKLNTININASESDTHAGLTSCDGTTAAKAYLIGDKYQLQAISLSTSKQYYKLVDDIDMTGEIWTSLNEGGDKIIDFNGNGKTISNMRAPLFNDLNGDVYNLTLYNSIVSSANTVGILANTCKTADSKVTNVTITGDASPKVSSLTNTNTDSSSKSYVGGLIGEVSTISTFDGCHIINTTISEINTDCTYTGGAFGYFHNDISNNGKVQNCTVESSVINSSNNTGGLIGYLGRGNVKDNKVGYDSAANEKKCIIAGNDGDATGNYKGGLIGVHRYGYVTGNKVNCEIKGAGTIGGLIGSSFQEISNNSSCGEVTASGMWAGGLVGASRGKITNCTSSSSVRSTYSAGSFCHIGGLAGNMPVGTISKCYAQGNVNSSQNKAAMGGLVGSINGDVTIEYSFATGNVAKGDGNYTYRGGLVGYVQSGTVTISNCYATGEVEARRWSGGLIGVTASDALTVTNCYTSSTLTFSEPASAGVFIGNANTKTVTYSGIIAWNVSNRDNFIFNTTITEAPSGNYFGFDGTSSIIAKATTLGWGTIVDGDSKLVWDFSNSKGDNRPHLAWEE